MIKLKNNREMQTCFINVSNQTKYLLVYLHHILQNILNKSENATPELFVIFIQNDAVSKANESVSECSKTGLCITVSFMDVVMRKDMKEI